MSTKKIMTDWLVAKEEEKRATEKRLKIEMDLYKSAMKKVEIKKEGTTNYEEDGVKLTIVSKMSFKVDQSKAAQHPELFNVKYDYSKTISKGLTKDQLEAQADMIVITPSKPSFSVSIL